MLYSLVKCFISLWYEVQKSTDMGHVGILWTGMSICDDFTHGRCTS